jgi:glycosyltransferase involved in cell wall biosynthesis
MERSSLRFTEPLEVDTLSSSAPRRVLLTSYPPDGGVTRQLIDVVRGLDPARWLVDLACPPGSDPWQELESREGVTLHRLAPGKDPAASDALDFRRLLRLVARADVVHAHASKAGFLTRLAAALRGRRRTAVFTPHAWSFWAKTPLSRLWLPLERTAAHWCRAIVAVSEHEREAGLAAGVGSPEQYRVIINGVDVEQYARPRSAEPGRIVTVGRLAPQKRPDVAVRAMAELARTHPEASLDVVAHGPLLGETEALVAELGLGNRVRLLGKRDDVPELLARAQCFLLTSDYEGCPYTVLEAMAAGLPVVATAVGGLPELIAHGETGLLAEPGNPASVSAALASVLADGVRARELGEAGRRRVSERFSREGMLRATLELYDEVASAPA